MKDYIKILCIVMAAFTMFALFTASLGIPFALTFYFDSVLPLLLLPFTFAGFIWICEKVDKRWR